jgi:phosphatidylglycerophosphatase A
VLWATLFGVGFAPKAPGTFGSIGALILWWALLAGLSWQVQLAVIVVYTGLSTALVAVVMRRYSVKDAPAIVADEVAGLWIALLAAPVNWWAPLLGFALFRFFDIAKPWPVGWLDRHLPGAWGVMADDLAAGLLSLGVLQLAIFLL